MAPCEILIVCDTLGAVLPGATGPGDVGQGGGQLGLLGDDVTAPVRPFPRGGAFASGDEHRWYAETGHGLHYGFLRYFDTRGGLDIFGYPISEELTENGFTAQYFQRARFEYHPEHAGTPYEVQLGLVGDQVLQQKRWLR